ncbi:MAG: RraA family protein [Clostridium sp.]
MKKLEMNNYPELLSKEIIERAEKLSSSLVADGMKGLDIPMQGCMEAEILPIDISMKVVGTAMTVDTKEGNNFPIHLATYSCKPGYVMVIDGKGYKDSTYLGGLIVGAAKAVGVKGIIIDGYVRDRQECIKLGLPLYSKGFMQRSPSKVEEGSVNSSINCGGVVVNPGDLIVADADGVTVVPRGFIDIVLKKAEEKLSYEVKREETIASYEEAVRMGGELPVLEPKWVSEILNSK